jgi:hypothetical protein
VVEKTVPSLQVLTGSQTTANKTQRSTIDSNVVVEKSNSEKNVESQQNRRAGPGSKVKDGEPPKKNVDRPVQATAATLPTKKAEEARVPQAKSDDTVQSSSSRKRVSFNPKREEIKAFPDRVKPSVELERMRGNSQGGSVKNLKSFWNKQNQPIKPEVKTPSKAVQSVRHSTQDDKDNTSGEASGNLAIGSQTEAAPREDTAAIPIPSPVASANADVKDTPSFNNTIMWASVVTVAVLGVVLTAIVSQQDYLCAPFLGALVVGQFEAPHWAPPVFKSLAFDAVCLSSTRTKVSWIESKRGFTLEVSNGDNILLRRERLARGHISKDAILLTSTKLTQEELVVPWKRA